jgi:glycosyltransferase involved in cell wall biosynthesis
MKIPMIDSFYYARGGSSLYAISLSKHLRAQGHEVFHFAMKHPNSFPSPETEKYFPSYIEFPELLKKGWLKGGAQVLKRTFYSKKTEKNLEKLLDDLGPFDVAHVHNYLHHLTPAIFPPLKKRKIPIVMTLHDYSLLCPNTNFFDDRKGKACEKCLHGGLRFLWAPLLRCKKSSFGASLIAALESLFHRLRNVPAQPDRYIATSEFILSKFVEADFPKEKFTLIRNFFEPANTGDSIFKKENYALYVGRLSKEKGVETLVRAWKEMPEDMKLKIAGTGPTFEKLKKLAGETRNIEFLGFVMPEDLSGIRKKALFTIIPSACYENAPLSVLESFADGVAVLGANIGGIPEIVVPGETGVLFTSGDVADLREKALYLWDNEKLREKLGRKARETAFSAYSPEHSIPQVVRIYENLSAKN